MTNKGYGSGSEADLHVAGQGSVPGAILCLERVKTAQIDGAIAVRVGGEMQNAVEAGPIDLAR